MAAGPAGSGRKEGAVVVRGDDGLAVVSVVTKDTQCLST
jgi:hypothetical protein